LELKKHKSFSLLDDITTIFKSDIGEKSRIKYQKSVDLINANVLNLMQLSNQEIKNKTIDMKKRVNAGESLETILHEAFAVTYEASRRVLGLSPFDTQLIGGIVLHGGQIAEIKTGEGKTLVAVLPAYLNALSGKGVHVITVNDYLAKRDSEWVGQILRFLGLKVGLIQADMDENNRKLAYYSDVTYVTNSQLGFDYLRDNLAVSKKDLVLRDYNYCVIDEVDSVLIDEARTPLIISGLSDKPCNKYKKANKIAQAMTKGIHYRLDEKQRNVLITDDGYEAVEEILQISDLYDPRDQWATFVINAIKARDLFVINVNYILKDGEVVIVDEFTGRTMPGRRWSDGLHQAIEAKEELKIQQESSTLASISYQNLFRIFTKLSGMTGTASTEAAEFSSIYNLSVTVVPTNRPMIRIDNPDVVFKKEDSKWKAVVAEVRLMYIKNRPVLIGTTSVEKSEGIACKLLAEGIPFQVLNAKPENVKKESDIIAQSGSKGAVTISTNMAGRGTDILLGGNSEFLARKKLKEFLMEDEVSIYNRSNKKIQTHGLTDSTFAVVNKAVYETKTSYGRMLSEFEADEKLSIISDLEPTDDKDIVNLRFALETIRLEFKKLANLEREKIVTLGGLHVIGTERHESRRVDNQLRGRAGRQGDPGSTRFFISLEDNLLRLFGGDKLKSIMNNLITDDLPIESNMLTKSLDEAQKKVESYFFDIRRNLFEYDQVLNTQRERVYAERKIALLESNLEDKIQEYIEKTFDEIVEGNLGLFKEKPVRDWDLERVVYKSKQFCYLLDDLRVEQLIKHCDGKEPIESLKAYMRRQGMDAYRNKKKVVNEISPDLMLQAERFFLLKQIDNLWKEHLQAIKFLQQAVCLRGYAQRDPLTEYNLEGFNLFSDMMTQIRRNVLFNLYSFQPEDPKTPTP
jgi:preprotein translocase subunit SecA